MFEVDNRDAIEQARKLDDFPKVAKQEFTSAMNAALRLSEVDIEAKAPVGSTGELRGSVGGEIRYAAGEEVRGVMFARAVAEDGFPYGYALDASKKYRYQGKRKRTKGWFKGIKRRKRKDIIRFFALAIERILNRLVVR